MGPVTLVTFFLKLFWMMSEPCLLKNRPMVFRFSFFFLKKSGDFSEISEAQLIIRSRGNKCPDSGRMGDFFFEETYDLQLFCLLLCCAEKELDFERMSGSF